MRRTGERILGILAILAGVAIVVAVAFGARLPSFLPAVIGLAVAGFAVYHYIVISPDGGQATRGRASSRSVGLNGYRLIVALPGLIYSSLA